MRRTNAIPVTTLHPPKAHAHPASYPSTASSTDQYRQTTHRPSFMSVRPSARLLVRPSVRPPVRPPDRSSARPSVRPSVRPSDRPSVRPSVRPFFRPSVFLFVRPFVRPSVRPSVSPSVRQSVRPFVKRVNSIAKVSTAPLNECYMFTKDVLPLYRHARLGWRTSVRRTARERVCTKQATAQ